MSAGESHTCDTSFFRSHVLVAASYNGIDAVYTSQGKYEEALDQYGRVLEIEIRVLGQDHPDVAASYNNIGIVYDSQGKYEEALAQYQKVLQVFLEISILKSKNISTNKIILYDVATLGRGQLQVPNGFTTQGASVRPGSPECGQVVQWYR